MCIIINLILNLFDDFDLYIGEGVSIPFGKIVIICLEKL